MKIKILLILSTFSLTGCVGPIGYVKDLIKDHKAAQLQTKELASSTAEIKASNSALTAAKAALADQSATITTIQARDATIQWNVFGTQESLKAENYPLATTFTNYAYSGFGAPLTPDQAKQVDAIIASVQDADKDKLQEVQAQADSAIASKNNQIAQQNTAILTEVAATKAANDKFTQAATQAATTATKLEAVTKQNAATIAENTGLKAELVKASKSVRNVLLFIAFLWVFMAWIMPGINKLCETIPALAWALIITVPLNEICHLILAGLHYILLKVEALFQKKLAATKT